jgi:succinate-semialdehyde dehydrogenase / glutarate-semialdehyde dehydrogenase
MALMFINGENVAAKSGQEQPVLNPASEEIVDTAPSAGPEDVDAAVQAAQLAFKGWSRSDADKRGHILRAGVERVRAALPALAELLCYEQGKPVAEAMGELNHFLHGVEFYIDLGSKIRGAYVPLPSSLGPAYGMVIKRPLGVCAAIVPYNFPITLLGTKIGPALVAGNTVVAKPAATTPLTTLRIAQLFAEAGLPPGVFNVVTGSGRIAGEALVAHPAVRRVAFTGGSATGRRVMELAGPKFKRVSLELGGSDPVIVCPDADLDAAVKGVVIGRFFNAGQACLAAKRVYIFDEVYEQFVEQLVARVQRYELGPGWTKATKPNVRMGPLNAAQVRDEVAGQLAEATSRGAKVLCGGEAPKELERGFYLSPAVVADAPHDSRLVREEVFGPVLPVFRVKTLDEAIERANDSIYGLGSSIWTTNAKWIHRAAQELEAGMTWVNQLHYGYDELPFGGVKESGIGREHGPEALEYYLEAKSVVVGGLEA